MASAENREAGGETVSSRAREMADRVGRLADDVIASFAVDDKRDRTARLTRITNEISFGMSPVVGWLERRRQVETAELVKRRLFCVVDKAIACVTFDIPEYVGGTVHAQGESPSEGACRTAVMRVTATLFASSLRDWAGDIDAEDPQRPDGPGVSRLHEQLEQIGQKVDDGASRISDTIAEAESNRSARPLESIDGDAFLSAPDLARKFKVQPDSLRKRLERWRKSHSDDSGWREVSDRAPREPRYLFRVSSVLPIIKQM